MQLFYNPDITDTTPGFSFDREESRHIIKVLRKTNGDMMFVTNGRGKLFRCRITVASDNKCMVEIVSSEVVPERPYRLHLAVAPTKMNDRYEWFLEKAAEIGVTEITPLICQRSERQTVKTERFHKILLSAMKQSLQCYLPILNEPVPFKEFIKRNVNGIKCVAHCEESDRKSLRQVISPETDVTVLIGPEGDFTAKEIASAFDSGYIPVSLGQTRLRTETAAITACHSVAFINEK
ncbi:MAG TPA: 16S rRNA (uracil(1498)-N(3))-methyltransferase [Flavobacterium sp.]|jgi:16S rRNA (uracil1498-N3)-methyltransferase